MVDIYNFLKSTYLNIYSCNFIKTLEEQASQKLKFDQK